MKRILLMAFALAAFAATAMPTKEELAEAQPIVSELMKDHIAANKKGKESSEAVGDAAMSLANDAKGEALKFVLFKGAVMYYARGKAYDKVADAVEAMMSEIGDIPPQTLNGIVQKAAANISEKKAPRLVALKKAIAKRAKAAKSLTELEEKMEKSPGDPLFKRMHAELVAATGDWDAALNEFFALGGAIEQIAEDEMNGSAATAAEFWWDYSPAAAEAKDAIKEYASTLYQKALDNGELEGLKRNLAEKRIAECKPVLATTDAAPKIKYKFNYILAKNGNAILCKTCNNPCGNTGEACVSPKPIGELIIPEYIDGHKVIMIGRDAFEGCDKMTKIVLPKSLESFGLGSSFCIGCYALKEIVVDDANPLFSTFDGALFTKDKKRLLAYPKARGEIRIPKETCEIEPWSFISYNLKTLKLPNGITYVKGYSLSYCPNLEVVEFPASVRRIDGRVFCGSANLKKVIFNGDAPDTYSFFEWAPDDIVVEVRKGSKGWNGPGSSDLPERWPHDGIGSGTRPIRYIR